MTERYKPCRCKDLEKMSTEQLDELLQKELEKEHPDEKIVLTVLSVLQEREKEYPENAKPKTEPTTKKRSFIWRAAVIAAVLCLVLMAVPRTVGAESIFQTLIRWTESVFGFVSPGHKNATSPAEYVFETDNQGLRKLYDTVVAEGVEDPVVPMWLPEGYELTELNVEQIPDGTKIHTRFTNGKYGIIISYRVFPIEDDATYEKKEQNVQEYECERVKHYIAQNGDFVSVLWIRRGVECTINTTLEMDTVYTIINSIY